MTSAIRPIAHPSDDEDNEDDFNVNNIDWEAATWDIQNRVSRAVGTARREARHFREFFGTRIKAVETKHLLWSLYFLKVYPKQGPGCSVVGGCTGTVDPKTLGSVFGRSSEPSLSLSTKW